MWRGVVRRINVIGRYLKAETFELLFLSAILARDTAFCLLGEILCRILILRPTIPILQVLTATQIYFQIFATTVVRVMADEQAKAAYSKESADTRTGCFFFDSARQSVGRDRCSRFAGGRCKTTV